MKTLQEISAPAEVTRKLLEKDVQKQCVEWARARGYWARKFSSMTQRSVPDYLFAREWCYRESKHGNDWAYVKFAVEFKAPGKASTEAQVEEHTAMRNAGWEVFVCDSFDDFKARVEVIERAETV